MTRTFPTLSTTARALTAGTILAGWPPHRGQAESAQPTSSISGAYGPNRPGNAPPASVTYSFPSALHDSPVGGDLDSLATHVTYLESIRGGKDYEWLIGIDWRRLDFGFPTGTPLPQSLQSLALVAGADWQFASGWRVRLEVLPGIYSDFSNFNARAVNAPFTAELAYSVNESLNVGGQLLIDGRRDFPVLIVPGVTWRFAERWLLSFWIPRPQVEFQASERLAVFLGASLSGGTYQASPDLGGSQSTHSEGSLIDYREISLGAGFRWKVLAQHNLEFGAGWTLNRRFNFTETDGDISTQGAPYLQLSFGRAF
ncbi:MAG TPA: DUF6268 family outer membrane beta-barrel protein [Verrucomicrobiota bacterium]|nr:DUF6268 family outer membrane beta-barrel protein [Verrucomicrobiota bacterium]